jgi:hypothetical protein
LVGWNNQNPFLVGWNNQNPSLLRKGWERARRGFGWNNQPRSYGVFLGKARRGKKLPLLPLASLGLVPFPKKNPSFTRGRQRRRGSQRSAREKKKIIK